MTISTDQLLKLISGMTGENPDIVLKEWQALIDSVKKLEPGQHVEISQLGTFKNEDGEITFEPNEALADEVNYEYTGQEPVVIEEGEEGSTAPIGISVASDGDYDEEKPNTKDGSETDGIFGRDDETESKEEATEPDETLLADKDDEGITREKKQEEEAGDISASDKAAEVEDGSERPLYESLDSPTEEEKSAAVVIPPVEPEGKAVEESTAEEGAAQAEAMAKKVEKEQEETQSSSKPPAFAKVAGGVFLVMLMIGGLIWYQFSTSGSPDGPLAPQPADAPAPVEAPAPADQTQHEAPAELLPEPREVATAQESVQPLSSGDYGLEGEIVNVPGRSYGIVVFSLSDLERAKQEETALREMGYRTRVITIEQDDQTLHRVSVGQFETPESAVEAGQSLPEPYRSNFFVRRFFP